MNFKKFKDNILSLKEIKEEIENTKDECELKIWKLIKTESKKLEDFIIEKEEELEWKLLRVRNIFFENLIELDKKTNKI